MGLPPRLRNPVKIVLSLAIAVLALELIARGWMAARGRSYSGFGTEQAIEEMAKSIGAINLKARATSRNYRLHPFIGWDVTGGAERIAEDREHFLSGEADESYDILLVGSSVAAALVNGGTDAVLRVVEQAPSLTGRAVRIHGYGRSAYKQPQQLMLLNWLLVQGFEPDAVICIDGFNEIALSVANGRRHIPSSYPGWGQWGPLVSQMPVDPYGQQLIHELEEARLAAARIHNGVQRYGLANSAILGSFCRGRMVRAQERWQVVADELSDALAGYSVRRLGIFLDAGGDEKAMIDSADLWCRATQTMVDLCLARDIPMLHVLQPNPSIPGSKTLSAQEEEMIRAGEDWILAATEGYPRIREARAELLAKGLNSLDATMIFQDIRETVWRDAGHLNRLGNEALGLAIGGAFRDLIAE